MAIHREQKNTFHAEWRKDTQWPCPDGFHIPTVDEWRALVNAWISIQVWESWWGDNFRKKMLMPLAGNRRYRSTGYENQKTRGYYWSATPDSWSYAYCLEFTTSILNPQASTYRASGFSLRPFRDEPVNPVDGEILKEWWEYIDWNLFWAQVIAWNPSLWLISLVYNEGHNCITIADKNLWATEPYYRDIYDPEATEPILSGANCGYYYQWWNNYGFPRTGGVSSTTTAQVGVSQYWPGGVLDSYFSRGTYYYYPSASTIYDWAAPRNDNLWWGVSNRGWYRKFYRIKNSDMRGPCPEGFHVPLEGEWAQALNIVVTLEWLTQSAAGTRAIATDLHLPLAGAIWVTSAPPRASNYRTIWYYRTATATQDITTSPATYQAYALQLSTSSPYFQMGAWRRAFGYTVRAFKDRPVAPDSSWTTIFDWSSTAEWAWIFWNAAEWLISLSLDWENWITMADKNVWATAVWNYSTAASWYSAANCGSLFQRWNNFPQPWASSSSYSPYTSTKIDTTWYWPWNYFNQDIVVTIWTSPDSDWSSVDNPNLWGWASQWTWTKKYYFR